MQNETARAQAPAAQQRRQKDTLWAVVVSHRVVPGDKLVFMCQAGEPTDAQVWDRILASGIGPAELADIRVTHAFNVNDCTQDAANKRALTMFVASGALGG